jgi:hypothetical protein
LAPAGRAAGSRRKAFDRATRALVVGLACLALAAVPLENAFDPPPASPPAPPPLPPGAALARDAGAAALLAARFPWSPSRRREASGAIAANVAAYPQQLEAKEAIQAEKEEDQCRVAWEWMQVGHTSGMEANAGIHVGIID